MRIMQLFQLFSVCLVRKCRKGKIKFIVICVCLHYLAFKLTSLLFVLDLLFLLHAWISCRSQCLDFVWLYRDKI